jgi:hypothetical protein
MSMPIDLSDALRATPPPASAPGGGKGRGRGTGTRLDDVARPALWIALLATALLLTYLGWGLLGGAWSNPTWKQQTHQYHLLQFSNIALVLGLMRLAAVVLVVALLICCLRDEGVGYALLGMAAVLYYGLPLLAGQIYIWQGLHETDASRLALIGVQDVALLYGVPGLIWSGVGIAMRFIAAGEVAAIRRANVKYATTSAARSLGVKTPSHLTVLQRRNRTYQVLSVIILLAEPVLVLCNLDTVKGLTGHLLAGVEQVTNRFTLAPNPNGLGPLHDEESGIILWTVLITLNLIVISQVLRLLEFLMFRGSPRGRLD